MFTHFHKNVTADCRKKTIHASNPYAQAINNLVYYATQNISDGSNNHVRTTSMSKSNLKLCSHYTQVNPSKYFHKLSPHVYDPKAGQTISTPRVKSFRDSTPKHTSCCLLDMLMISQLQTKWWRYISAIHWNVNGLH